MPGIDDAYRKAADAYVGPSFSDIAQQARAADKDDRHVRIGKTGGTYFNSGKISVDSVNIFKSARKVRSDGARAVRRALISELGSAKLASAVIRDVAAQKARRTGARHDFASMMRDGMTAADIRDIATACRKLRAAGAAPGYRALQAADAASKEVFVAWERGVKTGVDELDRAGSAYASLSATQRSFVANRLRTQLRERSLGHQQVPDRAELRRTAAEIAPKLIEDATTIDVSDGKKVYDLDAGKWRWKLPDQPPKLTGYFDAAQAGDRLRAGIRRADPFHQARDVVAAAYDLGDHAFKAIPSEPKDAETFATEAMDAALKDTPQTERAKTSHAAMREDGALRHALLAAQLYRTCHILREVHNDAPRALAKMEYLEKTERGLRAGAVALARSVPQSSLAREEIAGVSRALDAVIDGFAQPRGSDLEALRQAARQDVRKRLGGSRATQGQLRDAYRAALRTRVEAFAETREKEIRTQLREKGPFHEANKQIMDIVMERVGVSDRGTLKAAYGTMILDGNVASYPERTKGVTPVN